MRTFVRSPGFDTADQVVAWLERQGAERIAVERGPDHMYRGSGEIPPEKDWPAR